MKRSPPIALADKASVELTLEGAVAGTFALYSWKNLQFMLWFSPATVESMEVYGRLDATARERHPNGVSFVHFMVPGHFQLPSPEARAAFMEIAKRNIAWIAAIAVVIPGDGFWASAIRGMITALRVLGPRELQMRIHSSTDEIPDWLPAVHSERTGVPLAANELARALLQLRRTLATYTS
jgi:hypothetical protein